MLRGSAFVSIAARDSSHSLKAEDGGAGYEGENACDTWIDETIANQTAVIVFSIGGGGV